MIILGFFTTTAMQRLFAMQNTIPGIAKSTTVFLLSLKPDLPEVGGICLIINLIQSYPYFQPNMAIDYFLGAFTCRAICKMASIDLGIIVPYGV